MAIRRIVVLGVVCFLSGCGGPAVVVSGSITLDGAPLEDGYVSFIPEAGGGNTAGAPVRKGEYRVTALTPGTYRVQISVMRPVEIPKDDPIYAGVSQRNPTPIGEPLPPEALDGKHTVTVNSGSQVINFNAKKPTPPRRAGLSAHPANC